MCAQGVGWGGGKQVSASGVRAVKTRQSKGDREGQGLGADSVCKGQPRPLW